ncbi:MAG TPA: hypothetical protein VF011_19135 [Terriglobales bacterium]
MAGKFRRKIAVFLCCWASSIAVFGQITETATPGSHEVQTTAVALPDKPEPQNQNANSGSQDKQSGTAQQQPQQPGAPSLGDLGFPTEQTKPNPEEQARLDKRSHMLKIHQRLGLITAVPLVATVVTGSMAGGKSTSSTNRDLHAALGSTTAGLYIATAAYAIFAPKPHGVPTRGPIRVHKALAWIHGPGMILTPILGAMAFEQKSRGEKVHGIASAHAPVAYVTAIAYGAAIASVSFKF